MKKTFTILSLTLIFPFISAQESFKKANLNEDGTISVEEFLVNHPLGFIPSDVDPEPFMNFGMPAFPITKNTRGAALADLDDDGVDEILIGIDKTFYALKGDGSILLEKELTGAILLPPAVADLDDDGDLEIVINCGYPTTVGGVYVLDHTGADLPGWPVSFDGHWMINAPAVADLDDDGMMEIVTGERVSGTVGFVHILKLDGTEFNENWPIDIGATPAFTPSIGDVDNNGTKDIVIAGSSSGMYIINSDGSIFPGFPVYDATVSYSYQSPILVDLNDDDNLEIVGANHGDSAAFYAMQWDGTYLFGWPYSLSGWTYAPVTVADVDDDDIYEIFGGNPNFVEGTPLPTIYGISPEGEDIDNFPIEKIGGNEGMINIADVNNDDVLDLIFGSNITDAEGFGYIHAYSLDGSGEVAGFPLRPKGFTFLNGAVLGDVDNDGMMDLTANSYTLNFGAEVDSMYVNSYNLNVPFDENKILRNGYKGSNTRDGLISEETMSTQDVLNQSLQIYPNPSNGELNIQLKEKSNNISLNIYDLTGKRVAQNTFENSNKLNVNLSHLPPGTYVIHLVADGKKWTQKWIKL
ncbi:MAG: T9SS type A sorting domain-containing protein [Moheibacter sp.]